MHKHHHLRSLLGLVLAVLVSAVFVPTAVGQEPGVNFDDGSSPADREYAIPADEVREQTGGTGASDPGAGDPQSTGGAAPASGTSGAPDTTSEPSGSGGSAPSTDSGKSSADTSSKAPGRNRDDDSRLFGEGLAESGTSTKSLDQTEIARIASDQGGGSDGAVITAVVLAVGLAGALGFTLRRRMRGA